MHTERLHFKLEVHLNQTARPAVSKETHNFQLLTIAAPLFHTQLASYLGLGTIKATTQYTYYYIKQYDIMDMRRAHPFRVEVAS